MPRRKPSQLVLLLTVTALLFGFNLFRTITHQNETTKDFDLYAKFIDPVKIHGKITVPHFVYPVLVAIASMIFPGYSYSTIGACVVLIFQLFLAYILWVFWKKIVPARYSGSVIIALALATMIVAPINLLTLSSHNSYLGYIGITVYHNPTVLICRPIALLHFLIFASVIAKGTVTTRQTFLCFITLSIATLMKPNYALIVVPAALVFACWAVFEKKFRMLEFILYGTLLPAILILIWQFVFTYISNDQDIGQSGIIFAPLLVYSFWSHDIFLKFLLSVLFPVAVLIVCWKQVVNDRFYVAGLLLFLFGASQSYLFAEASPRMYDGNFFWSAQLGLFIWFIVSMRAVLQRLFSDSGFSRWSPRLIIVVALFSLHLISGMIWYFHETRAPGAFW